MSHYSLLAFAELLILIVYSGLSVIGIYYLASIAKTLAVKVLVLASSIGLMFLNFLALVNPRLLPIWGELRINYDVIQFPISMILALSFTFPIIGIYFLLTSPKGIKYRRPFFVIGIGTLLLLIVIAIYSMLTNIR
jgi:hypothetical protein